jgi:hypothetical protein
MSLQAYNGLTEQDVDQHLKQVSASGTETTYVDREFLRTKLAGIMEVTIKSATKLPSSDVRAYCTRACVVRLSSNAASLRLGPAVVAWIES